VPDCGLGEVEIPGHLPGRLPPGQDQLHGRGLVFVAEPTPLPALLLGLPFFHGRHRIRLSLGVHQTGSSPDLELEARDDRGLSNWLVPLGVTFKLKPHLRALS